MCVCVWLLVSLGSGIDSGTFACTPREPVALWSGPQQVCVAAKDTEMVFS